ncbi:MAG: zf-HC2 domain-containing protein [Actinomycetota bacterium]|nr:zf-HC2 domain-containing protein [Actinomycetota bacterium]
MNCEVAREALSARLDGEREPVPAVRVDEHLAGCAECRAWHSQVSGQADMLRRLARQPPVAAVDDRSQHPQVSSAGALHWKRWALLAAGLAQCGLGLAQAFGLGLGLQHGPDMGGGHLFNESTAWSLALGLVMVAAAIRPVIAAGLAGVLAAFVAVLAVYVVVDGLSGAVTPGRVLSHLPVVLAAVLAALVWRDNAAAPPPSPNQGERDGDIRLPRHASRGRRRGHLWPTDDSAA